MKLDLDKLRPARGIILKNAAQALEGSGAPPAFFGSMLHVIAEEDSREKPIAPAE